MNVRSLLTVAVGTLSVVVACGGSSGGGAGNPAGDTQSFVSQYCDIIAPCCAKANKPADGVACRNFAESSASGKQYDPEKGTACLTEIRNESSKPDFCSLGGSAPSCSDVFKAPGGGKKPGEACSQDSDCASSPEGKADCAFGASTGAEIRSCQIQIVGKEGDTPCVGTRDGNTTSMVYESTSGQTPVKAPERGYICDLANKIRCDSKTKACIKVQDVGGPCASTSDCVKTAFCDTKAKACAARLVAGGDCGTGGVSTDVCATGFYCNSTAKKCTESSSDGAVCTKSEECLSRRCLNGKCESSAGTSLGLALICGG